MDELIHLRTIYRGWECRYMVKALVCVNEALVLISQVQQQQPNLFRVFATR